MVTLLKSSSEVKMDKQTLLDQLQDCFEAQLELKERELQILQQLAEQDPTYKVLYNWLNQDLNTIYKESNND